MKKKTLFLEFLETLIFVVLVVLPIRYFIFEPFIIRGESMYPNFYNGDYIIAEKLSYFIRDPERYEVVVFKAPPFKTTYYIKRIIGLPGEKVEIKNGKIKIYNKENPNGFYLDENYQKIDLDKNENLVFELKENEYFVLGDNRPASFDSRKWGAVLRKDIIGRAIIKVFPPKFIYAEKK
jgi:signal peptidase I